MISEAENTAYLLLGSNMGNRKENINLAIRLLSERAGVVNKVSSFYSSEPWGLKEQDEFLNLALQIKTGLNVMELLQVCKEVENEVGRSSSGKWGPREIDIDIMFYNRDIIHESNLKVPHPSMAERKFVLQPMVEIDHDFIHPVLNYSLGELLEDCSDHCYVRLFKDGIS